MVRLVDDLLDVSRITHGQINLQKTPTDLAAIIARAVEGSKPLIESRGHTLTVVLPPTKVMVDADAVRLAQVLWNLLNNAAKYSPEKSSIQITVTPDDCAGTVKIRVRDTGMGIPREMLPRIFDLFTQIERSLERAQGGLGIGLTLVRRLTEMHGGTVEAFSDGVGCGSEFVVTLPMSGIQSGAQSSSAVAADTTTPAGRRILVVDDNRDSADSLATLLRLLGNDVLTAYDGPSALVAAQSFCPALVLLDLGLPGASGYDVAATLRQIPSVENAMLVALTGYGTDEDRRRTKAAGFDHHLTKPADLNALQELLSLP
jgi:CheY-like chemotaxis protein/two-component sensor histidine kinase